MGMILPGLVLFVLLVTLLVIAIYQLKGDNKPVQVQKTASPEELFADILCDSDADYEYKAVFRVGCPTPTFDMQQGYVDFELLGPGDYALGHPVRCALLPKNGEMHYFFTRATPVPPVTGIRAQHGDRTGKIMLFDYILSELEGDKLLDERQFNKQLTNRAVIYRGTKPTLPYPPVEPKEDETTLHQLLGWSCVEFIIILWFMLIFIATVIMLFEYFDLYFFDSSSDGSLVRSLTDVIVATLLSSLALLAIIYFYKYTIKKKFVKYNKETSPNAQTWCYACNIFVGTLAVLCITLTILLICMTLRISFTKSLYWLAAFSLVCVCVLGSWYLYETSLSLMNQPPNVSVPVLPFKSSTTPHETMYVVQSNHRGVFKTVFFDPITMIAQPPDQDPFFTIAGPKMANPIADKSATFRNNTRKKQLNKRIFKASNKCSYGNKSISLKTRVKNKHKHTKCLDLSESNHSWSTRKVKKMKKQISFKKAPMNRSKKK